MEKNATESAYALLNERRDAAWTALAVIRVVSSQSVIDAATALNAAIAQASPTKGRKRETLNDADHKRLTTAFIGACRKDLGRRSARI